MLTLRVVKAQQRSKCDLNANKPNRHKTDSVNEESYNVGEAGVKPRECSEDV